MLPGSCLSGSLEPERSSHKNLKSPLLGVVYPNMHGFQINKGEMIRHLPTKGKEEAENEGENNKGNDRGSGKRKP